MSVQPQGWHERYSSRTWRLAAVCVSVVLMRHGEEALAYDVTRGRMSQPDMSNEHAPLPSETFVECNGSKQDTVPNEPFVVTLSKEKPAATVHCTEENNKVIPQDSKKVCYPQANNPTVDGCSKANPTNIQVSLQELLGSSTEIAATISPLAKENKTQGEQWRLALKETDFPLSDQSFFVGCQQTTKNNSICKATVNVKARQSSARDNVVQCAYGRESNPDDVEVVITESNRALTLDCGKDGSVKPSKYTSLYCDLADLDNCTKHFSDIFPGFDENWWTKEEQGRVPAKLTIPSTGFPSEDRSFFIGCAPLPDAGTGQESRSDSESEQQAPPAKSTCKVRVTVRAASSASLALTSVGTSVAASVAAVLAIVVAGLM
ncbi:SAG-related sequence [Besnoitia besnoiti]|uniref:SAG-related sequence n=1 Tax=Besnoitia besnoiti TaxID=94643 RepID=A0A2A9MIF1_BESBE|nr:SAG-related sequence [Besnoitia besnoiti]PFH37765.1 SAG-related sequence [Besnoitia besnoiti]